MIKQCPKCGAERKSEIECPFCGIIYAKYEKMLENRKIKQAPTIQSRASSNLTLNTDKANSNQNKEQSVKKKKIINPIIVASIILALGISFIAYKLYLNIEKRNAEKEFSTLVSSISEKLNELAIKSEFIVDEINRSWRSAILDKNRDINLAVMEVKSKRANKILELSMLSTSIAEEIKKMAPPDGKEKDFQRLKELYLLFNKYAGMAVSPSGTLQTYSQQNAQLKTEIISAIKELELMK